MDNQFNQQPNIPQEPQQSQPSPQPTPQPTIQPETSPKQGLPTWIIILIVVGAIVVLAGASYGAYWYFASQPDEPLPANQGGITPGQLPTGELNDETADWQTYRNEGYGFEVRYPNNLTVREYKSNERDDTSFYNENDGRVFSVEVTHQFSTLDEWIDRFHNPVNEEVVESFEQTIFQDYSAVKIIYIGSPQSPRSGVLYFAKDGDFFQIVKTIEDDAEAEKVLSTFKFIEVDETVSWPTYRNNKYGFTLTFLEEWKGYKAEMYKIEDVPAYYLETTNFLNGEAVVYFSLEGGPSSLLKIYIHTKDQWNSMTKAPTYITENDKYVFSFDNSIMRIDALGDFLYSRWQETITLVNTFKFVD